MQSQLVYTENKISPEVVIAWLITQPNAKGKLYLENVVRQYMYSLRSVKVRSTDCN